MSPHIGNPTLRRLFLGTQSLREKNPTFIYTKNFPLLNDELFDVGVFNFVVLVECGSRASPIFRRRNDSNEEDHSIKNKMSFVFNLS